jgi:XRE family aerobic/anaerobic benzoate catabolism transcriptional regulator
MVTTPHLPNNGVLQALSERVRRLRRARGWSRAALAERSGLSVRFLARVEGGDGNISLLRLTSLARAFDTTADELIRPLDGHRPVVILVGMRGAGKSTVGPILAERLSVPFIEMDARIQESSGLPVDQIFELHGERYYRRLERETLARILAHGAPALVAAAGGVINEPTTWDVLRREARVVWLKARAEDHWNRVVAQGDRRPMADNPDAMAELRAMLAAREPSYALAHLVVDTTGCTPEEVALKVENELRNHDGAGAPREGSAPPRTEEEGTR